MAALSHCLSRSRFSPPHPPRSNFPDSRPIGVLEALAQGGKVSIEVLPPSRGGAVEDTLAAVEPLLGHRLAFVSVTDHPGGAAWAEGERGAELVALRTKPGTLGTAVALREAFGLPTLPHIVASGAKRLAVEDLLIDLHYAGFRDLFVIRGDESRALPSPTGQEREGRGGDYAHAKDLVSHIAALNRGEFAAPSKGQSTCFRVGVAAYPEKHFESPNLEADFTRLIEKVEAGADFLITQMLFSAEPYRRLVAALREAGLGIPVIPGIKPLLRAASLATLPRDFHIDIPAGLVRALDAARDEVEERRAGLAWIEGLCRELLDAGAPCLHFFTMGRGRATLAVLDAIFGPGGQS